MAMPSLLISYFFYISVSYAQRKLVIEYYQYCVIHVYHESAIDAYQINVPSLYTVIRVMCISNRMFDITFTIIHSI